MDPDYKERLKRIHDMQGREIERMLRERHGQITRGPNRLERRSAKARLRRSLTKTRLDARIKAVQDYRFWVRLNRRKRGAQIVGGA